MGYSTANSITIRTLEKLPQKAADLQHTVVIPVNALFYKEYLL
jgi:hypothetical protein